MARECYLCGKHSTIGRSQKHRRGVAGKRWMYRAQVTPRVFGANLQAYTITVSNKRKKVTLCSKCIKRIKFNASSFASL